MLQRQRFRYQLALLCCGLILTTGCNNSRKTESATTTPRAAIVGEDSRAPLADSPEQLIGRRPPPIQVAKWVKGEPLTDFEPGKVYVVDFWATWCGPCIAAIPHLTKLAQTHKGKLEVVGISISERQIQWEDALKVFETPAKEQ